MSDTPDTPIPIPIPPHIGGSYIQGDANTIMHDVWGYLVVKYAPRSVIDIGCGYGDTLEWFEKFLIHSIGIDGDPNCVASARIPGHVFLHDFTIGPPPDSIIKPGDYFDLAWSAEFLEHVEEQFMPNYMAIFRRCKYAVITHAEPGQNGHHHVNCQDDDYWVQAFANAGFRINVAETALLRSTDRWHAGWGRRTLMFFERL